jgi:hypothetical protein
MQPPKIKKKRKCISSTEDTKSPFQEEENFKILDFFLAFKKKTKMSLPTDRTYFIGLPLCRRRKMWKQTEKDSE